MGGGPVWVPFELVSANYTLPLPPGSGCFQANTNGLASGNHPLEAISHGLCEVVERDATTLWRLLLARPDRRAVDPATVDRSRLPVGAGPAARGRRSTCRIWDTTSDVGVASFCCLVTGASGAFADPEYGNGCHPGPGGRAAARADRGGAGAHHLHLRHARRLPRRRLGGGLPPPAPWTRSARDLDAASLPGASFASVPTFSAPSLDGDLALAAGAAPRGRDRPGDRGGPDQGGDRRAGGARRRARASKARTSTEATTCPGRARGGGCGAMA